MVKSDFENAILNYLAEDSMILDHYINKIAGIHYKDDKETDNYLMDRLSVYRKFAEYEFWKALDWLEIIKNFQKFASFHKTDEKIWGQINYTLEELGFFKEPLTAEEQALEDARIAQQQAQQAQQQAEMMKAGVPNAVTQGGEMMREQANGNQGQKA